MTETIAAWFAGLQPAALLLALGFYFLGGFVKGAVGFALPLVAVSGSAMVLPAQTAVAMVILPVLVTNVGQAFRQGVGPLRHTARRFWPFLLSLAPMIWLGAYVLPAVDERWFFIGLGLFALTFSSAQLIGWKPVISSRFERPIGVVVGGFSGVMGGLAGTWGPPTVLYLQALRLSKVDQVRAAGAGFLTGAIMLTPAHLSTGVLSWDTVWLSLAAIPPAYLGMAVGVRAQDAMPLALFRKLTLIVLILTALNLLRKAAVG